ncbi:MAG: hypothetical protein IJC37_06360, partial [Clostridia bacterium]|nr:hypothetical protein [Clostridia bacterium]
HRKGRSFDSAERFFYEAILTYGEEKNASMGRKSDLCGVFSSNAVTLTETQSVPIVADADRVSMAECIPE